MPKPRERDSQDKIKRKGGGRVPTEARRQLTAKFRKELAQRQRGDGENYEAQAVEQTEEISEAAVEEVYRQAKRGADRAGKAIQKHSQKRRQKQRDAEAPPTQEQPAYSSRRLDDPTKPAQTEPPTPQERMRQKDDCFFMRKRRARVPPPGNQQNSYSVDTIRVR